MGSAKRKAETIDLTNDSDIENVDRQQSKSQKRASKHDNRSVHSEPLRSTQAKTQDSNSPQTHEARSSDNTHALPPTPSQSERDDWSATQQESAFENDMRREIVLTADDEDAYENRRLYGILNTKIVGVRFYTGRATTGEYVVIRREPQNPYDKNAIRIDNVQRSQIGHIPRQMAAKLAPFMDSGELMLEGSLTGEKGFYDCPIAFKLFGTNDPEQAQLLKAKMQEAKLPVTELNKAEKERQKRLKELEKQQKARQKVAAAMRKNSNVVYDHEGPGKYSNLGGSSTGEQEANMGELLSNTATFNPREVQNAVNKFGFGEDILSKMTLADQPQQLVTQLLPYQRQGLQWMLEHESPELPERNSDETVQFWKNKNGIYSNIATSFSLTSSPQLASGGILADDMGLGKTIQIISLIMADPKKNGQPTLIVAPLSVMSNWSSQASIHIKKKYAPNVLIYHGQENRGLSPAKLKEYDIVITTYQTMTLELFPYGKDKAGSVPASKGLFSVNWRRVVLDEGHNIRNPKAKMSRAACSLMAESRWILTGTPIVNSLKDLFSHVRFLQLSGGMGEFEIFNANVIRPVKNGEPSARFLLQALMQSLCLRRMKDMKFIDLKLPELTFHKYPIQLLKHEQQRYDAFKAEARGLVEEAKAKKGDNTMTHLLEVLLRLRQTCNHWKMCGEERVQRLLNLVEEKQVVDVMDPKNRKALEDLLQLKIDSQEDCPVCMESMNDRNPVITACTHAFCRDCIERVIETQKRCPMCRTDMPNADTLVQAAANFGEATDEMDVNADETSSKIETLIKVLKAADKEKNTKTVVFSQWTSFLNLVQMQLIKHGLAFCRMDGKMNALKRDAAIESLNSDPDCKIMLASLSVCSVGLNLVAANHVILSDSWWAPAIEDQAVDRVHRLGQTRNCRVVRLVVEGTIEDEVLEIQARKRKLAATAFGEKDSTKRREEQRAGTLRDIERLLQ